MIILKAEMYKQVLRVVADKVGVAGDPLCIKIGNSSRLVPWAEKFPPAMYQDRVCFGSVLR